MSNINDLEVLSKYLSEEELKEIAKDVAFAHFSSKLKESNPYAKSNLEFYNNFADAYKYVEDQGIKIVPELFYSLFSVDDSVKDYFVNNTIVYTSISQT